MKKLRPLFLIVGAVLFYWLIQRIGFSTIVDHLAQIGWWIVPIFGVGATWYTLYALGWRRILKKHRHIGLWPLFKIKISGEFVNTVTPANFVGGDRVRVYLLRRYFPWMHGAASVVIDRTLHMMATLILIIVGAFVAFWHIPNLPMNVQYGLPIVLTIACGFVGFVFAHQRRGLLTFGLSFLKRLRVRRHFTPETVKRCEELDVLIADFHHRSPRGFWIALSYHFAGRMLGVLEIYMIGHLLNPGFGGVEALLLCAVAPLINLCFTFIPGAFGVMEGAYGGVLYLLSMPPSLGLTIQLMKRARAAVWIAVGFVFLSTHDRKNCGNQVTRLVKVT